MGMPCEYVSWARFYALAARLATRIRAGGYSPQVLIGVGRGGYLPARLLSDFLDVMDLTTFKIEHYRGSRKEPLARVRYPLSADLSGKRVLLVDDVNDSGDTFAVALGHLRERGAPKELRSAVLHHKITSTYVPDYYGQQVVKWRWITYPWALAEDLDVLLGRMSPRPKDLDAIRRRIIDDHGMHIPRPVLRQTLAAAAWLTAG
jgi:hypothetical protein